KRPGRRAHNTGATTEFLKSIPSFEHISQFLRACQTVAAEVDEYRGFEFTDPFDGELVRWNPVKRADVVVKSNGLQLLVSLPGRWVTNVETLQREFEESPEHGGTYPIDQKELRQMIAPCLVHALDATFAGLVIESLHKRGVRDVVSIHDGWMAPVAL